NVISDYEGDS
ncbi:hypothetical protein CP02DC14_1060B, partial [Chlamydia psittaci 02DC14]